MQENKEKNFISAVIYTYNEEENIFQFLKTVQRELEKHFEKYEIICVNDASTDNSAEEIKKFAATVKGNIISILNMSYYQGLESAMNAGVDLSIGDFVYEFDVPVQTYESDLILNVYYKSLEGYDIVAAAPSNGQRKVSKAFYKLFNLVSGTQYLLRTESFRVLSRRGINRVHSISKTIPYRKAVYANCGLRTSVLAYESTREIEHPDKTTYRTQKETALDAMILYTDLGYRFSMVFSIIMVIITALTGLYAICIYLGGKPVAGWTTTMLFLAFAFWGIFIILTIAIKYMSLILKLNFNKQKYIIESIEKINN